LFQRQAAIGEPECFIRDLNFLAADEYAAADKIVLMFESGEEWQFAVGFVLRAQRRVAFDKRLIVQVSQAIIISDEQFKQGKSDAADAGKEGGREAKLDRGVAEVFFQPAAIQVDEFCPGRRLNQGLQPRLFVVKPFVRASLAVGLRKSFKHVFPRNLHLNSNNLCQKKL